MIVTIDAGNSRIKTGIWDADELVASCAVDHDKSDINIEQLCDAEAFDCTSISKVIIASVAGEATNKKLSRYCKQHRLPVAEFFKTTSRCCGVTNAYADPSQHGVDRWAGLIGARYLFADESVCVIDVGTAVTIDLMKGNGQHYGGHIMPGLKMMRQSLTDSTEGVHRTDGNVIQFASNTADAVASGTLRMLVAGIEQAIEDARANMGDSMKVILTGGQAFMVANAMKAGVEIEMLPELVLYGLHAAAEQN